METENIFESLELCVAHHSRDWSMNKRDAWIVGIVCGWGENKEDFEDLVKLHKWTPETVGRLKRLHASFVDHQERKVDIHKQAFGELMGQIAAMKDRSEKYEKEEREDGNLDAGEMHMRVWGVLKELERLGLSFEKHAKHSLSNVKCGGAPE